MVDTTSDVIKLGPKLAIKNDKANGKDGGAPVNEHLVTELGEMLEMAKEGEIVAAAITAIDKDRQVRNVVLGRKDCGHQLISGSVLATRMMTHLLEQASR